MIGQQLPNINEGATDEIFSPLSKQGPSLKLNPTGLREPTGFT
jgi:hypothetical protein